MYKGSFFTRQKQNIHSIFLLTRTNVCTILILQTKKSRPLKRHWRTIVDETYIISTVNPYYVILTFN